MLSNSSAPLVVSIVGFCAQMVLLTVVLIVRPTLKLAPYMLSLVIAYFTLPSYAGVEITHAIGFGLEITGRVIEDIFIKTTIFTTLHIATLCFIEGYTLPHRDSIRGRIYMAYKMLWNGRRIGTNKVAPQIPVLEGHNLDGKEISDTMEPAVEKVVDPLVSSQGPSSQSEQVGSGFHDRLSHVCHEKRLPFTVRRLALASLLFVLEYHLKPFLAVRLLPRSTFENYLDLSHFVTRIHEVTAAEMVLRTYLVVDTTWSCYSFYTIMHSVGSVIFVNLRLDEPHEWPPLFGDIRQAYSMRRYWVKFYDRLIYRTCSEHAKFILRVLHIGGKGGGRDAPWQRWLLYGLIFTISAFMHAQASWWDGAKCGYWDEVTWWMHNFLALVVETAFQAALLRAAPRWYHWAMSNWASKVVGFSWIYLFMVWSAPKFASGIVRCTYQSQRS